MWSVLVVGLLVTRNVANAEMHTFANKECSASKNTSVIRPFSAPFTIVIGNISTVCEITLPAELSDTYDFDTECTLGKTCGVLTYESRVGDRCLLNDGDDLDFKSAAVHLAILDGADKHISVRALNSPINIFFHAHDMTVDTECLAVDSTGKWSNEGMKVVSRDLSQNFIHCEAVRLAPFVAAVVCVPYTSLSEKGGRGVLIITVFVITVSLVSLVSFVIMKDKRKKGSSSSGFDEIVDPDGKTVRQSNPMLRKGGAGGSPMVPNRAQAKKAAGGGAEGSGKNGKMSKIQGPGSNAGNTGGIGSAGAMALSKEGSSGDLELPMDREDSKPRALSVAEHDHGSV
jgi:hypothetical protein